MMDNERALENRELCHITHWVRWWRFAELKLDILGMTNHVGRHAPPRSLPRATRTS